MGSLKRRGRGVLGALLLLVVATGDLRAEAPVALTSSPAAPGVADLTQMPEPGPAAKLLEERWYAAYLGEQHTGWSRWRRWQQGQQIITQEQVHVVVRRGNAQVPIDISSCFIESVDHQPVRAILQQNLGAMRTLQALSFGPLQMELLSKQGDQEQRRMLPLPKKPFLTPAAAEETVRRALAAGIERFQYSSMDLAMGPQVMEVDVNVIGPERVLVAGKVSPATAVDVEISVMPGMVSRNHLDQAGRLVRSTAPLLPGMALTLKLADRELAQADVAPPELLAATMIKPDRPLAEARTLRRARYELRIKAGTGKDAGTGGLLRSLPSGGSQQVTAGAGQDEAALVLVDLDHAAVQKEKPGAEFLRASPALNSDDPVVAQLARQALAGAPAGATDMEKAGLLRQFVHHFVKRKDLDVSFATAGEVARTAAGDCTEHAMLLAALLRASGIPSRTVSGLLYVDSFLEHEQVFGYHMWTQAFIATSKGNGGGATGGGGYWLDLDAVLPEQSFDAAHIALAHSAMADALVPNDLVRVAPLIGRLEVKVVEP